jgi:hypothetical protein
MTNSISGGLKPLKDLWSDEKNEYEYVHGTLLAEK